MWAISRGKRGSIETRKGHTMGIKHEDNILQVYPTSSSNNTYLHFLKMLD
jgi:hypothetical protein